MAQGFDGKQTFGEQVAAGEAHVGTVSERLAGSVQGLIEMPDHIKAGLPEVEVREPSRGVVKLPGKAVFDGEGNIRRMAPDGSVGGVVVGAAFVTDEARQNILGTKE